MGIRDTFKKAWFDFKTMNKYPKYRIIFTKGKYFVQLKLSSYSDWDNYFVGSDGTTWSHRSYVDKYCTFDTLHEAEIVLQKYMVKRSEQDKFEKVKVLSVHIPS